MVDEKYNRICEKLGFVPSELPDIKDATEDDRLPNPFSELDLEETLYLVENGYLDK